jgi:hypothetical protein
MNDDPYVLSLEQIAEAILGAKERLDLVDSIENDTSH